MNTIGGFFENKKVAGDIAVEIELEGRNLPFIINDEWRTVEDGSLKGGMDGHEYVMTRPVDKDDLLPLLKRFKTCFDKAEVANSFYAGTHVHINVQQLTTRQLINYICACFTVEDFLVNWCGNSRIGNHFCLRSSDAEFILEFIKKMIEDEKLNAVNTDNIRYCFLNLKSLSKYGSLEFRSLNSTIDPIRINKWCQTLFNIRNISTEFENPIKMLEYIKQDRSRWLKRVFRDDYVEFVSLDLLGFIEEGIEKAEEIAYTKDWTTINFNIFKRSKICF